MSDTQPIDPHPAPEPNPSTSHGPAGWPGATHFWQGVDEPAPRPARVEEVEAIPLSKSQARGPAIEVEAERVASEPRASAKQAESVGAAFSSHSGGGQTPPPPPPFQAPPPPTSGANAAAAGTPHTGTRAWVVIGHLAYLIPFVLPGLILTTFIWVVTRRDDPFSDDQARESINFQLFCGIISLALAASCILSWFTIPVWLAGAVLSVVAAVNAGDGKKYRYPYIFRLIA